ncbi:MAG: hypothetical protein JO003_09260 [Candidatus Eremiobacteraeota bacterium]|nr:hypothetical protein [Candidatus Eremiobacteraeota bacterium]
MSRIGGSVLRVGGIMASAALAAMLCLTAARASLITLGTATPDLASQLMLRLFGETSDSSAAFSAARGDRVSESPLRDLAFRIAPASQPPSYIAEFAASPLARNGGEASSSASGIATLGAAFDSGIVRGVRFAPPVQSRDDVVRLSAPTPLTAAYQPVPPLPNISPGPGTVAFDSSPQATGQMGPLAASARLGPVQFQGHAEGSSTETPALSLRDNSSAAGANFLVRAGKRDINLDLSTQYEQLVRNDNNSFTAASSPTSAWLLPGADAPLAIPSYSDLNRVSVGAGVAVPVLRGLTLNLNYGIEHLYGGYGLPGLMNLDAVNNSYGGKLTFDIPDASKTLSISAYQERFSDSVLPINGSTQTHEDVNFTVKF